MPPRKKDRTKKPRPKTGHVPRLDKRIAKALSHPLRTEIVAILSDTCASPSEMADMLGEELSDVSYHTKVLRELDCVEIVEQERVRGSVRTRYRATLKMLLTSEYWDRLSLATRTGISANALNELGRRIRDSVEAAVFDRRKDRSVLTLKMDLDEQGWIDANAVAWEGYERMEKIQEEAANRAAKERVKTFRVTASLLVFESQCRKARSLRERLVSSFGCGMLIAK
ncbi:MAG TPA: helix-turn-helix domain-containing protein [Solirubrobacterales bacterium]|nr:helix-turn-helix domain-containing protein [Solirubrobacterales bacterium]